MIKLQAGMAFVPLLTLDPDSTIRNSEQLLNDLEANGIVVDLVARSCVRAINAALSEERTPVKLVLASNACLGFRNGARILETHARGRELGLALCPAWVAPVLRQEYRDIQPHDERLYVAMEPVVDANGRPSLFKVSRIHRGLCLSVDDGAPRDWYGADKVWVFSDNRITTAHGRAIC